VAAEFLFFVFFFKVATSWDAPVTAPVASYNPTVTQNKPKPAPTTHYSDSDDFDEDVRYWELNT